MRCALAFYFVVTMFVVPYVLPDQCVFKDREGGKAALCGTHDVLNTFEVIPPISQYITYINLRGQPLKQLPDNAFQNLSSQRSISTIRLEDCEINHVDAGALLYLYNLTFIDLSHNDIKQIDSKLFSDTKQIQFIYMEYNKIEVLPSGLFHNLQQLEVVHLQHNRIRQVELFSFKNTPSLRIIYLNNNQMEFINMLFKNEFNNLTSLSLYGNPWKCDCKLGPLYVVVKSKHINLHELVCEKPPTLHGKYWNDISRDEFVCSSEEAISKQDSVITSTEPMITAEPYDNVFVTDYGATTSQQVHTGVTQPPVILNWIQYTILGLVFVGVAAILVGVVLVVRHTLASPNRRRKFPTNIKRESFRRPKASVRGGQHCRASENGDSGLNSDEDVDEELTSIHHFAIREATRN